MVNGVEVKEVALNGAEGRKVIQQTLDITQFTEIQVDAIHFCQKSELGTGNDVTFELTTFQVQVRKARYRRPLLFLVVLANTS